MTPKEYDMWSERVLDIYTGMWRWIKEHLEELRDRCCFVYDAKKEYLEKKIKVSPAILKAFGYCVLCDSYELCRYCKLRNCMSPFSSHTIIKTFLNNELYHGVPVSLDEARAACDRIIEAHEELRAYPTQMFFNRLEEVADAERTETGVENKEC